MFACYVSACYICCDDANHKGKLLFSLCLYIASVGIVNEHFKLAFLTMYFFSDSSPYIPHFADHSHPAGDVLWVFVEPGNVVP